MQIGRPGRWRRRRTTVCMTGGLEPQFARRCAIEQPGRQHAVIDQRPALAGHTLGVKRLRTQTAPPQRIVDHIDARRKQPLAELVPQEAGLARNRAAVDGAGEMPDQGARNAAVEHHRHLAGWRLARIEPLHGTLTGVAPDFLRRVEIGRMQCRRIVVVALHTCAFAGDRGHRYAVTRAEIGAGKAVTGHQHHAANAGGGRGATRLGDALHRQARLFRAARHRFKPSHVRQRGIEQIEVGKFPCQQRGICQPGERIVRRDAGHRHGALRQRGDAIARDVIGRNHRLTFADQHAQAHVVAFGSLGLLDRAVADFDG